MKKMRLIKKTKTDLAPAKITNDTVEKHRQEVLEKGRKFKYPVQYSKHKLVINAIIVGLVVVAAGCVLVWQRLYRAQDTSDFMYRITAAIPLSVAEIDGENVRYSDYLAQFRSNMSVTQKQEGVLNSKEDEDRRSDYYKRESLNNAIMNAYAQKLARENGINVSNEEIEKVFNGHRKTRNTEISESAFNKIIEDNYQLSTSEYRRMFIELPLLRQKVSAKIDENALKLKNNISADLKNNNLDFEKITEKYGKKVEVSSPGFVKSTNIDGGRTEVALKLKVGEISAPFISKSGDGYYIVKLLEKREDEISYSYIKVPFTELNNRIAEHKNNSNLKEFIEIKPPQADKQ